MQRVRKWGRYHHAIGAHLTGFTNQANISYLVWPHMPNFSPRAEMKVYGTAIHIHIESKDHYSHTPAARGKWWELVFTMCFGTRTVW